MIERVLLDTGPIVAMFIERGAQNEACLEAYRRLATPLITCWPVITEAAWLMRRSPQAVQMLMRSIDRGLYQPLHLDDGAPRRIAAFMRKYADLPADLTDAALMYLAEQHDINTVFTLDRRDFSVYRRDDGRPLELIP